MEAFRRLVTVECKVTASLRPMTVFLQTLMKMPRDELAAVDTTLLDFATFRGIDANNKAAMSTTHHNHHTPVISPSSWPPKSTDGKKRRVFFCDSSILIDRQLLQLHAAAQDPSSATLCYVFPFSSLLLVRVQGAQAQGSPNVSNAFRVGVFSQLRQLAQLTSTAAASSASIDIDDFDVSLPPPVCVLPPSLECELWRRGAGTGFYPPESLVKQHAAFAGEAPFSAFTLPIIATEAQRAFGAKAGESCIACVASSHRAVQAACLQRGIFCDSLANADLVTAAASVSSAASPDNSRRKAAAMCRQYARKLQALGAKERM